MSKTDKAPELSPDDDDDDIPLQLRRKKREGKHPGEAAAPPGQDPRAEAAALPGQDPHAEAAQQHAAAKRARAGAAHADGDDDGGSDSEQGAAKLAKADGSSPVASLAGSDPDEVMADPPGGHGRDDSKSQDSSPPPRSDAQQLQNAAPKAARAPDDGSGDSGPEPAEAAAPNGAAGGARRSERLAALVTETQREAIDFLTDWVFPVSSPTPQFTVEDLDLVAAALSAIFKDADAHTRDIAILYLDTLLFRAGAETRAEELFDAPPPAGGGRPPGIECLRRLTGSTGKWPLKTTALFPGGEPALRKLSKAINTHCFPGGGDALPRAVREHHMHMLVKALYHTKDDVVGKRNAAVHMAFLLGTHPVEAGRDGKSTTVFWRAQPRQQQHNRHRRHRARAVLPAAAGARGGTGGRRCRARGGHHELLTAASCHGLAQRYPLRAVMEQQARVEHVRVLHRRHLPQGGQPPR